MRLFQYSPDKDRAVSVNHVIMVKETTATAEGKKWTWMVQKSSDKVNWTAHTNPTNPREDNAAVFTVTSNLAGQYIRIVTGGSQIPISNNYVRTGESVSPCYYVLTPTAANDSIFADIEVRSADSILVSKNNHGDITQPIITLNREPVKDDFQDYENVLAIVNRPTYFTFDPAPLVFTSANGFSQFAYVSSNAQWELVSKPDFVTLVREGKPVTAGNGTLSFSVLVDTAGLSPGIYNEYVVFRNLASNEEIHVPLMIDVDVPLTVNEQPDVVNITFYRDADAGYDSEELRIVRDRYWHFSNFDPIAQYFEIGRMDGSHNAATVISLKPDYARIDTATYTFFCISNNYIVRINITVRISAYVSMFPRRFILQGGQSAGNNTAQESHDFGNGEVGRHKGFIRNADGSVSQKLVVTRFNHRLVGLTGMSPNNNVIPPASSAPASYPIASFPVNFVTTSATGNLTWLKIEKTSDTDNNSMEVTTDTFLVTFYPVPAAIHQAAGNYTQQFQLDYRIGTSGGNAAGGMTLYCDYNVPRVYSIKTVNEAPVNNQKPSNPHTWHRYKNWTDAESIPPSTPVPYLYTTKESTLPPYSSKSTGYVYVEHNLSSAPDAGVLTTPSALSKSAETYTDTSGPNTPAPPTRTDHVRKRGVRAYFTTPASFKALREVMTSTVTIPSVSQWSTWSANNTQQTAQPNTTTIASFTVDISIEARRQHFFRGNNLGTLLPDMDYRRLGSRFVHNPGCQISAQSKTGNIRLILHSFQDSAAGYNLNASSTTATHVGAEFFPSGEPDPERGTYLEYGRTPETALSLTSTVPDSIADNMFIGERVLTATLSTHVFHGYDTDNLITPESAVFKRNGENSTAANITALNIDSPCYIRSAATVSSTPSTGYESAVFQDFSLRFDSGTNYANFYNRGNKAHQLYDFGENPRVLRGLAIHQPPFEYNTASLISGSSTGIVYYIETRLKYKDGSYGNWQPLMLTRVPVAVPGTYTTWYHELTVSFRTCVPRLASQVRVFRKNNPNTISVSTTTGNRHWSVTLPYIHFYENTPLFYKANADAYSPPGTQDTTGNTTALLGYSTNGLKQSLPFFNSHAGFYIIAHPNEIKKWDDIADGNTAPPQGDDYLKSSDGHSFSKCQNLYRYKLVSALNLAAVPPPPLPSRTITNRDGADNYIKLSPARRQSQFNSNVLQNPESSSTTINNTAHTSINGTEPICLTGAVLYTPYNKNNPFAGCMLLQSSLDEQNWIFGAWNNNNSTYSLLGNAYTLSGALGYDPFAVFTVGNYFGSLQLTDSRTGAIGMATAYLLANQEILNRFARDVSKLTTYTKGSPIVVLNDHEMQGSVLRGVPSETDPENAWEWTSYGGTLYLSDYTGLNYTETALRNDSTHVEKNKMLRRWIREVRQSGGQPLESILEALTDLAIYAPATAANMVATVKEPPFRRYVYNNDFDLTNVITAPIDAAWLELPMNGTWSQKPLDESFFLKIEQFYHRVFTPHQKIKYLSISCGGFVNIFSSIEKALQYGDVQLFHRYKGVEVFFDDLPGQTNFRQSQTFDDENRYYSDTCTFDPSGWARVNNRERAEDWTDCYYGAASTLSVTRPRQTKYLSTNTDGMRTVHAFQAETNTTTSFNNQTSGSISCTGTNTQSFTFCAERSNIYRFALPVFTYIYLTEQ